MTDVVGGAIAQRGFLVQGIQRFMTSITLIAAQLISKTTQHEATMKIEYRTPRLSAWLPLALALLLVSGTANSAEPQVPKVITAGFDAYKKNGPTAAIEAWLAGSALAGDKSAQSQAASMSAISTYYGQFQSAAPIAIYKISPSSTLTFMEARFEKGAGFMKFLTFNTGKGEIVTVFLFHTNPEQILPGELLYPSQ